MKKIDYKKILSEEIHSVVVATVREDGLPQSRVVDIMLYDEYGLYFLTAKGKDFYKQLMDKKYISLSGITGGGNSMSKKSISISGDVKNIGVERLDEIFEENEYMCEIYPEKESRTALEVFCLYKGSGEFFDLSTKPITRGSFAVGKGNINEYKYSISNACVQCRRCVLKCPTKCIREESTYRIVNENCLHCGNCYEVCEHDAVVKGYE